MDRPPPHKPGHSPVVTPASVRTNLLKLSRPGFPLDIDNVDGVPLTQKPSCRAQALRHKHAQAVIVHRSFVGVSRLQINKDESITAREARTQDSHHDELTTREGFGARVFAFKVQANERVSFSSVKAH